MKLHFFRVLREFRLSVGDRERVYHLIHVPHEKAVQRIEREPDAMIRDPPLREIIGADALRAVARPHLAAAVFRIFLFVSALIMVVEAAL